MTMSAVAPPATLTGPAPHAPPSSHRVADQLTCTRKPARRAQDFRQTRSLQLTDSRETVGHGTRAPASTEERFSMYGDKALTCADCSQDFVFTASEQEFYASRDFTEPRRCPSCRARRKAARGDTGGARPAHRLRRQQRWLRRRQQRWRRVFPRPSRDVHRNLLQLRQGGIGPLPPHERQARLLQRLLRPPPRLSVGANAQHRRTSGMPEAFSLLGAARRAGGRT